MQSSISSSIAPLRDAGDSRALTPVFAAMGRALNSTALATAGLVIKAAASTLAKTGAAAFYGLANGRLVTVAAATDMPALTGLVIAASSFNVACFFIDKASVVTVRFGAAGTALGAVTFPDFPLNQALVGFVLITHSAIFTGGTTALDTATTVYFSPTGAVDPSIVN